MTTKKTEALPPLNLVITYACNTLAPPAPGYPNVPAPKAFGILDPAGQTIQNRAYVGYDEYVTAKVWMQDTTSTPLESATPNATSSQHLGLIRSRLIAGSTISSAVREADAKYPIRMPFKESENGPIMLMAIPGGSKIVGDRNARLNQVYRRSSEESNVGEVGKWYLLLP